MVLWRANRQWRERILDPFHDARIGAIEVRIVRAPQDNAVKPEFAHRGKGAFVGIER